MPNEKKNDEEHGVRLSYKFRIYPTPSQCEAIKANIDASRFVYNHYLRARMDAYERTQQGRRPFKGTSLAASVLCTVAAVGNLNVAIKNGVACFSQAEAGVPLIASHPADFLALLVSATFTVLLIIVAVNSYRRFAGSEEVRNLEVEQAKTQLQLYRCEKKLEKLIEEQQEGSEDDR